MKIHTIKGRVYLHTRVEVIVEHHEQSRYNFVVEFLFKDRREVGRHLADGVARCVSHARVLEHTIKTVNITR